MTEARLHTYQQTQAVDENEVTKNIELTCERPLTLYIDKTEIVTLMTIGAHPELLTLGYIRNQGFLDSLDDIHIIQVDWDSEAVAVVTRGQPDLSQQLSQRTITTGCGQGTVFGRLMDKLKKIWIQPKPIKQSSIYHLLNQLRDYNQVYKQAGAVHGCALCSETGIEFFVEDVGRHNAVDAIAGHMWLNNLPGDEKIFYTTGRLTSEMVIKITQMGIPVLLSRSGATQMGVDMAKQAGVTLITRAKGKHLMILNGAEQIIFDAKTVLHN